MKTVYIINSLEGGGAERVFAELISLVAQDPNKQEPPQVILLDKLNEVYTLPEQAIVHRVGNRGGLIGSTVQFVALLRLLMSLKPKLIVSFLTRANIMNVVASKILRCHSIVSERSNTSARLNSRHAHFKRGLVGFVYRKADFVIAVSRGVADCLIAEFGVSRNKLGVLNNPVDLERVNNQASLVSQDSEAQQAKIGVVAMGRLVRSKGFDDLIRAYKISGLSCGLSILGEGPERENLSTLVDDLALTNQVDFLGFVANPYQIVKQAHLFVLSSHLEGFPNALLEAMALRRAVIATNCTDGPREILSLNGQIPQGEFRLAEFGLMVNVGDQDALSKAMQHLFQNTELLEELAGKAQERVKQYSKQHFYQSYQELLDRFNGDSLEYV